MNSKWDELYKQKLMTADQAASFIDSGSIVIFPLANGAPPAIMDAIADRILADQVRDLSLLTALEVRPSKMFLPQVAATGSRVESGYVGPVARRFVQMGTASFTPVILSESSQQALRFNSRSRVETVTCVVSPMDKHGFFSTGVNPDWAWQIAKEGKEIKNIIVEVNEKMPRTHGDNAFHISEVAAIVENTLPLVALPEIPISKEDELIAQYIAEEIPDEATIQLGIGGLPNAVANFLTDKRDLGIHSEMITDSMLTLFKKGVVTCAKKTYKPWKWLGGFVLGSQELYDFVDDNPLIEMRGVCYINDPYVCGLNDKLMSINSTIEVDLTGQCASESIGHLQYSGIGGQVDFVRGAWRSNGGKSFLTCNSTYTDKEGNLKSKIVPTLSPGAFVTTLRGDTQYVVTEYGIAYLRGFSVRDRAEKLIQIAHPDFRDQLRFEARKLCFVP